MTKTTFIYALIDPRDQTHHYIGKTVQNPPQKRLRQHLLNPATDELAQWIAELAQHSVSPDMQILETVRPDGDWRAAEIYWIRFGFANDWCLKNRASGGDDYLLAHLAHAAPRDVISRVIYASEDTFCLMTSINAYVMRGKVAEDDTFRDLLHTALLLVSVEAGLDFDKMKRDFCQRILSHGIIQMGRGWRVPVIKKQNPIGGAFFTVGKPFAINGISIPGQWDKAGWRCTIKMYVETSELLDTLATEMHNGQRRGYDAVLQQSLNMLASVFDSVVAM